MVRVAWSQSESSRRGAGLGAKVKVADMVFGGLGAKVKVADTVLECLSQR